MKQQVIPYERMQNIEQAYGITICGILVDTSADPYDGKFEVSIKGEVLSSTSRNLSDSLEIQLVCKNNQQQVLGVGSVLLIEDEFAGYCAFDEIVYCHEIPSLVKIVPKKL